VPEGGAACFDVNQSNWNISIGTFSAKGVPKLDQIGRIERPGYDGIAIAGTPFEEKEIMKIRLILLAALLALQAQVAHAQMTVDFTKITCKQFVISKFARPKSVAYWLSGYYNGKSGNTVIDIRGMEQNVHKLETYCRKNYDMAVMDAAKDVLGVGK
jgi:acid stress chaperone HdeB